MVIHDCLLSLSSEVLANGVKTSTFGRLHYLPAAWMAVAGRLLGVDRASRWGEATVKLLERWQLY